MMSTVVADLARSTGLRYVFPATIGPMVTFFVILANAPRIAHASRHGPSFRPGSEGIRWS